MPRQSGAKQRSLKVVQTVFGRFHHFDLARQLHRHGCLEAIFTGYPRWKLNKESLPMDRIHTFPWLLAPLMAKWRMGWQHERLDRELSWWMAETLDRHVARNLPQCDAFVAISGSGLHTARRARARGVKYICDRGSSHIRFSERILTEEFTRWGQSFPGIDPRSVQKEEREYELADAITVPSEFCRKSFVKEGIPAGKLNVVPYGVDMSRFSPDGEPAADSFDVLFVGQVSFRKGLPYLLEAFERVRHPNKRLTIVGAVQQEMREFLNKRDWPQVRFLGPRSRDEVRRLMSRSHVFILPSVEDGFGMVLAEALACGCPVIGTEHTGTPDLVENGREGFIVPIRDAAALSERMEQLCQDAALRQKMAAAALHRVRQLGGWNDYGDSIVHVLSELVERPRRNPHHS